MKSVPLVKNILLSLSGGDDKGSVDHFTKERNYRERGRQVSLLSIGSMEAVFVLLGGGLLKDS